jgi:hypothetical protein
LKLEIFRMVSLLSRASGLMLETLDGSQTLSPTARGGYSDWIRCTPCHHFLGEGHVVYRGTSFIRNHPSPRTTVGP